MIQLHLLFLLFLVQADPTLFFSVLFSPSFSLSSFIHLYNTAFQSPSPFRAPFSQQSLVSETKPPPPNVGDPRACLAYNTPDTRALDFLRALVRKKKQKEQKVKRERAHWTIRNTREGQGRLSPRPRLAKKVKMSSLDEKNPDINVGNRSGSSEGSSTAAHSPTATEAQTGIPGDRTSGTSAGVDQAWKFLNENRDATEADTEGVDMKALRRKIDIRIVPLLFFCYTVQFLDKVILNVCIPIPVVRSGAGLTFCSTPP